MFVSPVTSIFCDIALIVPKPLNSVGAGVMVKCESAYYAKCKKY
jgi:hypothetical protein